MTQQLDILTAIEEGEKLKEQGMERALESAEKVDPFWRVKALDIVKEFLNNHEGEFLTEDIRAYAALKDFPLPPSARAWGGVINKAAFDGLIKKVRVDMVTNPKAHRCFANVWIKNNAA